MSQVLLVDDEKNVLTSLAIGLRRSRYSVREARSGKEALDIMEEDPCQVVISDIRMEPINGYCLAEKLKEKYPETMVVLMSAYDFEEDDLKKRGCREYHTLTKPFPVDALLRIVKEACPSESGERAECRGA